MYDLVTIEVLLTSTEHEGSHIAYKQAIPMSRLNMVDHQWLEKIIAIINDLEVPNE